MKKLLIFLIFMAMPTAAYAAITTGVYRADGNTPYNGKPIMVGTKLTIIGSANTLDPCACALFIPLDDYFNGYGELSAGDFNDATQDYADARFPAAGDDAVVWDDIDPDLGIGFDFYGSLNPPSTGDWFIIDYTALSVGDCSVTIYKKIPTDPGPFELTDTYTFHHVPTRDFYQPAVPDPNVDPIVNFADYAVLAGWWQQECESPGGCDGADLDASSYVDVNDLMLFCDYWLESTE